ncbi:hypothetical protein FZC33_18695 [Labrys sp. KNU-23]|uniref:hypothetical protein n=1 Tax=Labrys sp. KNU-23 TaxID=2789216 RepID=UPI0011ECECAC|nr:hypothetical protein [Labrys sp. KNU-23]QEN88206.1 hypothetical protein FZC33_18695 [Labrys sp. KNU-23]
MPRFPDYDAEIGQGLQLPVAGLSEVPPEAAAYQARIARQNAFDDEERFNQRRQQRQAELDEAAGAMPPGATGFAAGVMRSTQKGDSALLGAISPANRPAFATRLAADREALLGQAAVMEQQGRARYEAGELDNAFAINEQDVARDPSLQATARQAYFGLVDSSGQTPAQKAQLRQDAERGFAIAAWHSRFADDPEAGAAALGRDDAAGGTPGDPAFAAIPKAEHSRLIGDAFLRRDQSHALARGALEPTLRDAETALTSTGRYDAPLPDETRFVAAYGREEGPRRHGEFQRIVKLGADVDAIKAMTPAEQTAWLARFAPTGSEFTGNGPDFAEGRERHARAVQAIALNLAARHKNPNAYVRAVYPALDRLWSEAESSPDRLKAALAATNAAMDGLGLPAQGRAVLPKAMIDKALTRFGDTARPLSERIAPFRALITAPDDPAQQANLFAQAMLTGLPRLAAPALAAYSRGEDDSAARLLAAAFDTPANREPGQPADSVASAAPTSPLALRGGADASSTNYAWRPVRTDTVIDLGPAMAGELARLQAAGRNGLDPLTAKLFDNIVQNTLSLNGGDPYDAVARASQAIRRPGPMLYAQNPPKTLTDAPSGGGSGSSDGGPIATPSPGATVDDTGKAVIEAREPAAIEPPNDQAPQTPPPAPEPPMPDKPPAPSPMSLPSQIGRILRGGLGRGSYDPELAASNGFNTPEDTSETYPNSPVYVTYRLSLDGGARVTPAVSDFIRQQVDALPRRDDAQRDSLNRRVEFGTFNTTLLNARRDLWTDQNNGIYRQYYSDGGYDFSFARGPDANSEATVVAVRKSKREPAWFSGWFFHDEGDPAGPWFGTPAPEVEPNPATELKPEMVPLGTPATSSPLQPPTPDATPQPGTIPPGAPRPQSPSLTPRTTPAGPGQTSPLVASGTGEDTPPIDQPLPAQAPPADAESEPTTPLAEPPAAPSPQPDANTGVANATTSPVPQPTPGSQPAPSASTWDGPDKVEAKLPPDWLGRFVSKKMNKDPTKESYRWWSPEKKGRHNHIRIDKGDPNSKQPSQRVDHVVIQSEGRTIGRDGNPIIGSIRGDAENAHIPLSEWENWRTWNAP